MFEKCSKLHDAVSGPVASTRDALVERLQSLRDTAYLLYQKTKEKLGYGQSLKDTVVNESEEAKEQQQDHDEQHDAVPKMKLVYEAIDIKKFRLTGKLNGFNIRMIMADLTPHIEMRVKVIIYSFKSVIHSDAGEIVD